MDFRGFDLGLEKFLIHEEDGVVKSAIFGGTNTKNHFKILKRKSTLFYNLGCPRFADMFFVFHIF